MNTFFGRVAKAVSDAVGTPYAFAVAVGAIILWAALGPVFGFSQTWQLFVNTGTTIITFLMVFVIQNAQNRDQLALQIKLDELLRALEPATTGFVDIEELDEETLAQLEKRFKEMHERHSQEVRDAADGAERPE